MNVDTMRRIDRQAGVPLCAIATVHGLVVGAAWPPGRGPRGACCSSNSPKWAPRCWRSPRCARRAALGADLFFVIFKRNVGSIELLGDFPAANICTIRDTSILPLRSTRWGFLMWTRRKDIDTVVGPRTVLALHRAAHRLCGRGRRVGFHRFHQEGLYRGEMLTHRVSYNPHIHISKNLSRWSMR